MTNHPSPAPLDLKAIAALTVAELEADIPMEHARAAFAHLSHTPDQRASFARTDYARSIAELRDLSLEKATTDRQRAAVLTAWQEAREGYAAAYLAWLAAQSHSSSWHITGRSGRRRDASTSTCDRRRDDCIQALNTARARIRMALSMAVVADAGGPLAMARKRLALLEASQEAYKAANKIARSRRSDYTLEQRIADIAALPGLDKGIAGILMSPQRGDKPGFAEHVLVSNRGKIKRLRKSIAHMEAMEMVGGEA